MSSSDLDTARAISRRLFPEPGPERVEPALRPAADPAAYVRLGPAPRPAPAQQPAAAPSMPEPPPGLSGAQLWGPLLDWCRAAARAESAFLLGPEGLVVECRGTVAPDDAQAVGARLMTALEQARLIDPEAAAAGVSVVIETGGRVLTGLALALADGTALTMGITGKEAVRAALREAIVRGFARL